MFQWTSGLSVGDELLDGEHQTFILKINELAEAGRSHQPVEDLKALIEFLGNYAKQHFADEEEYMANHHYPDIDAHIRVHDQFVTRVVEWTNDMKTHGATPELAAEVSAFMGTWLIGHIQSMDQAFAVFVKTGERREIAG